MEILFPCLVLAGAALTAAAGVAALLLARAAAPRREDAPASPSERPTLRLLAAAAHDLRAPLASVHGYSARLARQPLPPRAARYAERIARGARHMGLVADQLTDMAVLKLRASRPRMSSFALAELASDACAAVRALAEEKGQTFLEPRLPPGLRMSGDRAQLGRALVNLLANAVKFSPPGARVELRAWTSGRSAVFEVRDTGPGVPYPERRRIFDAFHRARWSHEEKGSEGWGLGLAVAEEAVSAHGGEISVRGGPGAVFRVRVPLRGPSAALRAPLAAALALLLSGAAGAELPVDAKARLEETMAVRGQAILERVLGQGRSAVAVNAELDFGKVERLVGAAAPSGNLPYPKPFLGAGDVPYETRSVYPASLIKRLTVSVVLDKKATSEEEDRASRVLSDVLDVRPDRGDSISFLRVPFASPPGRAAAAARSAALLLGALAACGAAALFLLRVARAVESMARPQHPPLPAVREGRGEVEDRLTFEVRPDQAEALRELLSGQDPDNIALVAAHLPPEAGRMLVAGLPEELRARVAESLGKPRFVDPDLILEVKEALERRLRGAVGGRQVAAMILPPMAGGAA